MGLREHLNLRRFRSFVHRGGAVGVAAAALVGTPSAAGPAPDPPVAASCAVWVVRDALASREAWREALDAVERVGCRAVLLQVSGRWDAWYESAVFPAPQSPPRGEGWADDPFGRALAEARSRGIEVHAWVNALLAWSAPEPPTSAAHVFRSRPGWFVPAPDGRSMRALDRRELDRLGLAGEGWFLDPARVDVRTALRRFVLELATRYPVDGVHLDYIRYPAGWAPRGGADAVTLLVALVRADLRAVRPAARLSVAVMPRPEIARGDFGQDWEAWLERGLVDEAIPMAYRDSPRDVVELIGGWPPGLPPERVRVGLRLDRLDPAEVREVDRALAARGFAGIALFSHRLLLDEPTWRGFGAAVGR